MLVMAVAQKQRLWAGGRRGARADSLSVTYRNRIAAGPGLKGVILREAEVGGRVVDGAVDAFALCMHACKTMMMTKTR